MPLVTSVSGDSSELLRPADPPVQTGGEGEGPDMGRRSGVDQVIGALSDATGRSDEEIRAALALGVAAAGLVVLLKVLNRFEDLGSVGPSHTRS